MSTHELVRITTADGVSSRLSVFRPAYWPRALVVCLPALGVDASYYRPFAEALTERRFLTVTADFRGNGTSSVRVRRGVSFGYTELLEYDIPAVLAGARAILARDSAPRAPRPLLVIGHSLGGQLGALHAGQAPDAMRALVLIGACTPYHAAYGAAGSPLLLGVARLYETIARVNGVFPGKRFRFGSTEAPGIITDWATTVRTGRYDLDGARADYEAGLGTVKTPVLTLSIEGDRYAPRRSVDQLVEKLSGARVTRRHLDERDLQGPALDHFRWARNPGSMVDVIERWLGVQGF